MKIVRLLARSKVKKVRPNPSCYDVVANHNNKVSFLLVW